MNSLQCVERSLVPKAKISSTTHVQLLQWPHGKQQQQYIPENEQPTWKKRLQSDSGISVFSVASFFFYLGRRCHAATKITNATARHFSRYAQDMGYSELSVQEVVTDFIYVISYYLKRVTTSWTDSTCPRRLAWAGFGDSLNYQVNNDTWCPKKSIFMWQVAL